MAGKQGVIFAKTPNDVFQSKLNIDDHKDVKKAADNIKKGLAALGLALAVIPAGFKLAKSIIFKK